MKSSHPNWQKIAGFILPMLFGWFLMVWVWGLTFLVVERDYITPSVLIFIPIVVGWFGLVPLGGFTMGIINAFCWKNLTWFNGDKEFVAHLKLFIIFWLLSLIGLLRLSPQWFNFDGLMLLVYGAFWVFPLHFTFFRRGQECGKFWIKTDAISRFLGRKNEWEED